MNGNLMRSSMKYRWPWINLKWCEIVCPKNQYFSASVPEPSSLIQHYIITLNPRVFRLPHGTRYPAEENQLSSLSSALLIILFRSLALRKITLQFKSEQTHRYYCIFPEHTDMAEYFMTAFVALSWLSENHSAITKHCLGPVFALETIREVRPELVNMVHVNEGVQCVAPDHTLG